MRAFIATLIACLCAVVLTWASHAEAHGVHHRGLRHHAHHRAVAAQSGQDFGILGVVLGQGRAAATQSAETAYGAVGVGTSIVAHATVSAAYGAYRALSDPRPRAWCGWYLRHLLGVADRAFNRAAAWARYGHRAAGPAPGVIVVWSHHVGIDRGSCPGGRIIQSGNDGHAVRTRCRSIAGAFALRAP